jgi:signal transduction histidine kinase
MDRKIFKVKKKKRSASLKMRLFTFFAFYFCITIGLLMFFQVNYLEKTYQFSRIMQIKKVTTNIKKDVNNKMFSFEEAVSGYDVSVQVINESTGYVFTINPDTLQDKLSKVVLYNLEKLADQLKDSDTYVFVANDDSLVIVQADYIQLLKQFDFKSKGVFYITQTQNDLGQSIKIVTYGNIVPIQSTIIAIREQIYMIAIIMLILSIILSLIIYRTISKPIKEINKMTKEITKGNYDVEFKQNDYAEIQELSDSLNNMTVQLGKVEKMQRELIANVSHDLRTPLTMISGYGEVIRDIPNENTKENIQVIIDEANHLTQLVNNMLDASKLQSDDTDLNLKDINVYEFVYEFYNNYSKMLETTGNHIKLDCDDDLGYIKADPIKMQQVMRNLVNNAVKYGGEDKTVIISVHRNNKVIRFEVTDHGQGIPEDQLSLIWNRYYKVDRNNTRSYDGSGLGLSIVKTILQLHNVNYGVSSKVGEGTTFYFEFPKCEH